MHQISRDERALLEAGGVRVTYRSGASCGQSKTAAAAFQRLCHTDVRVHVGGKANRAHTGLPFEGARALPGRRAA